jgi:hypothetical protein
LTEEHIDASANVEEEKEVTIDDFLAENTASIEKLKETYKNPEYPGSVPIMNKLLDERIHLLDQKGVEWRREKVSEPAV